MPPRPLWRLVGPLVVLGLVLAALAILALAWWLPDPIQ